MFNLDLLSIGINMSKSCRNDATVMVDNDNVIISSGDNMMAIWYVDEGLKDKKFAMSINDYPENLTNIFVSGDKLIFKTEKNGYIKTIEGYQAKNDYSLYYDLFQMLQEKTNKYGFIAIPKDQIDQLDDSISFFNIDHKNNNTVLSQFHGYTGKITTIEKANAASIDSWFSDEESYDFKIGTITSLWKLIYNQLEDIRVMVVPGCAIFGIGTRGGNLVTFIVSDATWSDA